MHIGTVDKQSELQSEAAGGVVLVEVQTTAGPFPADGFSRVPANEPIRSILVRAAEALGLPSTDSWVATVDGVTISSDKTYRDQGLRGRVRIDWGPEHGGGGCIPR